MQPIYVVITDIFIVKKFVLRTLFFIKRYLKIGLMRTKCACKGFVFVVSPLFEILRNILMSKKMSMLEKITSWALLIFLLIPIYYIPITLGIIDMSSSKSTSALLSALDKFILFSVGAIITLCYLFMAKEVYQTVTKWMSGEPCKADKN